MSVERRLVSLRRRVPGSRRERYGQLWTGLVAEATKAGAHAWRFVSPRDGDLYLEFLEFKADADPRAGEETRRILREMDADAGVAEAEEWADAG
jgi:hypothetical protein